MMSLPLIVAKGVARSAPNVGQRVQVDIADFGALLRGSHRPSLLDLLMYWKGSAACKYVGNTGHFDDMIHFAGSEGLESMKVVDITFQKNVSSSPLAG